MRKSSCCAGNWDSKEPERGQSYCSDCGRKKIIRTRKYDFCKACGHQRYSYYYECPKNRTFWAEVSGASHDSNLFKQTCQNNHNKVILCE